MKGTYRQIRDQTCWLREWAFHLHLQLLEVVVRSKYHGDEEAARFRSLDEASNFRTTPGLCLRKRQADGG